MNLAILHQRIEEVVPTISFSVGSLDDKSTWKVQYKNEPTKEQLDSVANIIKDFDITKDFEPRNILNESIAMLLRLASPTEQKDIDLKTQALNELNVV